MDSSKLSGYVLAKHCSLAYQPNLRLLDAIEIFCLPCTWLMWMKWDQESAGKKYFIVGKDKCYCYQSLLSPIDHLLPPHVVLTTDYPARNNENHQHTTNCSDNSFHLHNENKRPVSRTKKVTLDGWRYARLIEYKQRVDRIRLGTYSHINEPIQKLFFCFTVEENIAV